MKSFHVKIIAVGASAMLLIGLAVCFHISRSDDSVAFVEPIKPSLTQPPVKPSKWKSQASVPESFRMTPLPPFPPPTSQALEVDPLRDLRQAPSPLLINDQLVVAASTHYVESIQESAGLVEPKNVPIDFDAMTDSNLDLSAVSPTQNVRQASHWFPVEDRYDRPTNTNLSDLPQELAGPAELKTQLNDPNVLAFLDIEKSPQGPLEDVENSSDSKNSELDPRDAGRSAGERQSPRPVSDDSAWTTELLFEQIRNQRVTAAQHEIRWSLNDAISAALIYSNRVSSLRIEPIEEYQNVGVQSGRFDVVGFAEQSFRDSTEPVGSTIDLSLIHI